jgi:hypothetical protein
MFAIDDATAVALMPTPEAAGTAGFFTEGNPALGQAATYLRASFLNGLQQELLNLLSGAGITPSKTAYDQLLTGLRSNALVYGSATGAANTYAVAYTPAISALVDGMVLWFKASASNTGASTLNINAVGAKAIVGGAHAALQGGEIIANGKCMVVYNATLNSFVLIECTGAALQVAAATQSSHAVQFSQVGQHLAVLTTNGNFTVPAGVYSIDVEIWGGGGSSGGVGSTANGTSSGGGSGGYARGVFAVTPGQVIAGTIGAGGLGSTNTAGGTSSFGALLTAGGGGAGTINGVGTGGAAGAAGTGGIINLPGQSGSAGLLTGFSGAGGAGASAPFGGAGGGGAPGAGSGGGIPGGGGGGRGSSSTGSGSDGARGQINIRY